MSGYKTFADLDILTAAEMNDYLMSQVVARFASTGARTTAIASPTTGQITYVDGVGLQMWDGSGWTSAPLGAVQLVARHSLTSSAASVTFSSIPAYKNLRVVMSARGDITGTVWTSVFMRVNNDASANYASQGMQWGVGGFVGSASAGGQTYMDVGLMPTATTLLSGMFGAGVIEIPSWTPVAARASLMVVSTSGFWNNSTPAGYTTVKHGLYHTAGPYTSLTIYPMSGNWVAGSEFSLYGLG